MNLQKEINKVMNLSPQEMDDLVASAEEFEPMVKELMKEYKQFSDMMARKSRLSLLESNYDYLIFRAKFEMRKNFIAIREMVKNLESDDRAAVKESLDRIAELEELYGTESDQFKV
ncbi:MAG: hypothetical protein M1593_01020 [Candidatus Thermoplasmatota archaeon]|nr:hypothetical protein [Candidatus Thermoplasmatota archaeon]